MEKETILVNKTDIVNRKLMNQIYRKFSVDTGEPFRYSFPLELAIGMFGNDAYDFLYEVGQGLCASYITEFKGVRYVCVSGFELMKSYRGAVLYREMVSKWKCEVENNDTSTGKSNKQGISKQTAKV